MQRKIWSGVLIFVGFTLAVRCCQAADASASSRELESLGARRFFESASTHSRKGEWERAIGDLNEAIRLNPNDALAHACRAGAFYATGNWDKSISDSNEAIRLEPTNAQFYCNRAGAYQAKGELTRAFEDVNHSLRLDTNNAFAFARRASIYQQTGATDKAIADANQSLRLDSTNAFSFRLRGFCYFTKREFTKALEDFYKAKQLGLEDREILNAIAWLRATCPEASVRDGNEAVKYATKACRETGWSDSGCLDTLAAAFAEAGDFDKALEYQKRALAVKDLSGKEREDMERRLKLYERRLPYRD